jgi:predicted PurR-regulated permease PerM
VTEGEERVEKSAVKVEDATDKVIAMVKVLGFLVFVLLVVVIGLAYVVHRNSQNIENLDKGVHEVQESVDHVEDFVNELEQAPPEEVERNAAISEAVRQVPQIKSILCEQFPNATACRE